MAFFPSEDREEKEASVTADTVFRISSHCFAFILPQLGNPAFIALALNRISGRP